VTTVINIHYVLLFVKRRILLNLQRHMFVMDTESVSTHLDVALGHISLLPTAHLIATTAIAATHRLDGVNIDMRASCMEWGMVKTATNQNGETPKRPHQNGDRLP